MSQLPVRAVEFGGFPDAPWVGIDDFTYGLGDDLGGRHGFEYGTTLSPRLLRITVALAVARTVDRDPDGGWRSAEELALTADNLAPPNGTRKFLWSALRVYTPFREREIEFTRAPDTHLIQYRPLRWDGRALAGGRTRGPYRLGVPPQVITLDVRGGLAFLGHPTIELPADDWRLPEALAHAQASAQRSDYSAARAVLQMGLHRGAPGSSEKQWRGLAAEAYHLLGQYGVQLHLPDDAIRAARRARALFKTLRHPAGVVSALLTEAHAHGQLGNESDALFALRRARTLLDDVVPRQRRPIQAECAGVSGRHHSRVRGFEAAERALLRAFHLAQAADDRRQVCLWATRRAENFLGQRNLAAAERVLSNAFDLYDRFGVGGMERSALWRATASFSVAIGRLDEARQWLARAIEFARAHRLEGQLARLSSAAVLIDP